MRHCILTQLPCCRAGGWIFKELQLLNPMLGNISFGELAAGWCLSFLLLSVSPPLSSVMPPCLHALFGTGAEWMAPCQPRKTTVFIRHFASCSSPHTPSLSNSSTLFLFPSLILSLYFGSMCSLWWLRSRNDFWCVMHCVYFSIHVCTARHSNFL